MNILVTESSGFSPAALDLLQESATVVLADLCRPELEAAVQDADVLWVRLRNHIDGALLNRAPRLKVIATPTTGLTHIDLEAAASRGVRVVSLRGETEFLRTIRATAEHTLGLMLSLLRNIPAATAHTAAGGWDRDAFQGQELYGRTVGIIGYGRLGRIVARYLQAFEARVLVTDRPDWNGELDPWVHRVPLEQLLRESDIVSLHASLAAENTAENRGLLGTKQFQHMKSGALFVNTARGELIDEAALEDALLSGHLAGAALDVLAGEPLAHPEQHPLVQYARTHRNLLLTPHIGGCTRESMERTELFLARRLSEITSALANGRTN